MILLWKAIATVTLFSAAISWLIYQGFFISVHVNLGLHHYAEVSSLHGLFPPWIKMPFNTMVNVGYIIVGAYWCAVTTVARENKFLNDFEAYMFYLFNVMSGLYGAVQMLRIIIQKQEFAVLDQWCTLPFFAMVLIWSLNLVYGWNPTRSLSLMLLSLSSYSLTLLSPVGFEMVLTIHIVAAVAGGVIAYKKYPDEDAQFYFVMAVMSCAGFIGLKLLDLKLPQYHDFFKYISGHFLSKIADILQIHFVNGYFQTLIIQKIIANRKSKTVKQD